MKTRTEIKGGKSPVEGVVCLRINKSPAAFVDSPSMFTF